MKKPILISPVSSLASLKAAVDAGADGVYFGLSYNMRNSNLSVKDVDEIKKFKIKKYLTLNSVVYDSQLKDIEKIVLKTKDFIDAYICWDMAIIQLLKKYKLDFIISTQASISNLAESKVSLKNSASS